MNNLQKSSDEGVMFLTRMGADVAINGEDLNHRMRLIIDGGYTYDISVFQIHKGHSKGYQKTFGVGSYVVDIECFYEETGEYKGFFAFKGLNNLVSLVNRELKTNFKDIKIVNIGEK